MNQKRAEIAHFSQLKHVWWGTKTVSGQKRYFNKAQLLKRKCNLKRRLKILEVGCGDGEFTKELVRITGANLKITAIDLTPKLIERAKRNIKNKRVAFRVDDSEAMAFLNKQFDLVCGVAILHHLNLEPALKEIYRVLKKGGEIFFTEPNLLNPNIFLDLNIKYLRKKMGFSPNEVAFKRWELKRSLKKVGFKNIEVNNIDFLHPLTPVFLIGLVEKVGKLMEKTPLLKEASGSLMIYAQK